MSIVACCSALHWPYFLKDAHEFLGQVLDQLKEEADKLNKDHSGADDSGSSDDEARVNRSLLTGEQVFLNPTSRNFEFEVLHTITCTKYVKHLIGTKTKCLLAGSF